MTTIPPTTPVKRGRPPLAEEDRRVTVTLRLSRRELATIRDLAAYHKMTPVAYIRMRSLQHS